MIKKYFFQNLGRGGRDTDSFRHESGVVMLFSIILISVILSAAFALFLVFTPKIRSSGQVKDSVGAFYAADTGIEWCLYVNRKVSVAAPSMSNGAAFTVTPANCASFPITSVGTYRGVTRALEVNF